MIQNYDAIAVEFETYATKISGSSILKRELECCNNYFENLKKRDNSINILLYLACSVNYSCSTCLLASHLFCQVCCSKQATFCSGFDFDDLLSNCARSIIVCKMNLERLAVATQLQLGFAHLICRKLVNHSSWSLLGILKKYMTNLSKLHHIEVIEYLAESLKLRGYASVIKGNSDRHSFSIRVFCETFDILFSTDYQSLFEKSDDNFRFAVAKCIINWLQIVKDLVELKELPFSISCSISVQNVLNGLMHSNVTKFVYCRLGENLDFKNCMLCVDYLCEICELFSLFIELAPILCQAVLPILTDCILKCNNILTVMNESSASLNFAPVSFDSNLQFSLLWKSVPVCAQSFVRFVGQLNLSQLWLHLLRSVVDGFRCIPFTVNELFDHYECFFHLIQSISEELSKLEGNTVLVGLGEDVTLELIRGSVCREYGYSSALNDYRSELRDFLREITKIQTDSCVNKCLQWILNITISSLTKFCSTNGSCWMETECWMHVLSSVTKEAIQLLLNNPTALFNLLQLLSDERVVCSRPCCRLVVVIIGDILVNVTGRNEIVNRCKRVLLFSVFHAELCKFKHHVSFRTKQDHIGAVTIAKCCHVGLFSECKLNTSLFERESTWGILYVRESMESVYNVLKPTGVCNDLVILLQVTFVVNSKEIMTWKSFKVLLEGSFTAFGIFVANSRYDSQMHCLILACECFGPFWFALLKGLERNGSPIPLLTGCVAVTLTAQILAGINHVGGDLSMNHTSLELLEGLLISVKSFCGAWTKISNPLGLKILLSIVEQILLPILKSLISKKMFDLAEFKLLANCVLQCLLPFHVSCGIDTETLRRLTVQFDLIWALFLEILNCLDISFIVNDTYAFIAILSNWKNAIDISPYICSCFMLLSKWCVFNERNSVLLSNLGPLCNLLNILLSNSALLVNSLHISDLYPIYNCITAQFQHYCQFKRSQIFGSEASADVWNNIAVFLNGCLGSFDENARNFYLDSKGILTIALKSSANGAIYSSLFPQGCVNYVKQLQSSKLDSKILEVIIIMVLADIPGNCFELTIKTLAKFYIVFGVQYTSVLFIHVLGNEPIRSLKLCQRSCDEIVGRLSQFALNDWEKFKVQVKCLSKSVPKQ